MAIVIRRAGTKADRAACFALRFEVFVDEQRVPAEIELDAHEDEAVHFLAEQDGVALATARVLFKDGGRTAKIGRVAVKASARGTGLGAELMRTVEADPALAGASQCALEAQIQALGFYERLGYVASGDVYLDAGIPHRWMTKARADTATL